jgi:hypothetical protein
LEAVVAVESGSAVESVVFCFAGWRDCLEQGAGFSSIGIGQDFIDCWQSGRRFFRF